MRWNCVFNHIQHNLNLSVKVGSANIFLELGNTISRISCFDPMKMM